MNKFNSLVVLEGLRITTAETSFKSTSLVNFILSLTDYSLENINTYAGFLMGVGILGMISFGLSFSICYMRKKPYKPE